MDNKFIPKLLLATFFILMVASVTAPAFSITEPDGTGDSTSGYFTVTWVPRGDFESSDMIDGNTISCYADGTSAGYDQTYTINTEMASDLNKYRFNTFGWTGRTVGTDYYIWCISDFNSDVNAYSSGALTLTQYTARDVGPIAIDIAGYILKAFAENIGAVATILVVIVIVIFLVDMITGVFGLIKTIRGFMSNR